jgi:hypothetical protein
VPIKIIFAAEVYDDLQQAVDFYNSRKKGLGSRFFKAVKIQISRIQSNAYSFQIRYSDIRCSPINKFPFMMHYRVLTDPNVIMIIAILGDYRNPEIWDKRS